MRNELIHYQAKRNILYCYICDMNFLRTVFMWISLFLLDNKQFKEKFEVIKLKSYDAKHVTYRMWFTSCEVEKNNRIIIWNYLVIAMLTYSISWRYRLQCPYLTLQGFELYWTATYFAYLFLWTYNNNK